MPFWSVVRSLPQREAYASERCQDRGYETFLPLVETKHACAPLFAGYFFIRILERWRAINSTYGVLCLVRVGDCPCRMPDAEIEALKARADDKGVIHLPPPPPPKSQRRFLKGEKVKIIAGPFASLAGIHTGMRAKQRELVLINVLGATRQVAVARHLIAGQ
jgi:transcriptional antiterminator RfaH